MTRKPIDPYTMSYDLEEYERLKPVLKELIKARDVYAASQGTLSDEERHAVLTKLAYDTLTDYREDEDQERKEEADRLAWVVCINPPRPKVTIAADVFPRDEDLVLLQSVGISLSRHDSRYGWTLDHEDIAAVIDAAKEHGRLEEALRIGRLILAAHNGKE